VSAPFYKFGLAEDVPHWIYHRVKGDREWQAIDVDGPKPLTGVFPLLTIECDRKQRMPDLFESGSKAIVSDRFRRVCERFGVAAEFLPIKVVVHGGEPAEGGPYWFLHLLERVDCIDYDASIFEAWSDRAESEFRRVSKLVFREDAIGERALFKPKRYSQLFASQQLRDSLVEADCVVAFTPTEKVRLGVVRAA
jgi:uncharacterized protein DUF1629